MYPNPKTRKGQAWYQILKAITVGTAIFYPLFLIIAPLAPETTSSGGFLDFSPFFESLFLAVLTFPLFVSVIGLLLSIRRFVCVKTNEPFKDKWYKTVNILYIVVFSLSVVTLIFYLLYSIGLSELFALVTVFCIIIFALVITAECTEKHWLKKHGVIGIIKPVFEVNIFKNPIFTVAVILLSVILLSIPTSHERASFEYDPNGYIYNRTNSFLYSYIKAENRETHQTADLKFVIFPFNYKETSELFGFK